MGVRLANASQIRRKVLGATDLADSACDIDAGESPAMSASSRLLSPRSASWRDSSAPSMTSPISHRPDCDETIPL